jgi:hypothetical protein
MFGGAESRATSLGKNTLNRITWKWKGQSKEGWFLRTD